MGSRALFALLRLRALGARGAGLGAGPLHHCLFGQWSPSPSKLGEGLTAAPTPPPPPSAAVPLPVSGRFYTGPALRPCCG